MNSSRITSLIAQPELIAASDLDELKALASEYTYSETFQLLYLYSVSKHADMYFDEALLASAFRISKRERILALLEQGAETTVVVEEEQEETAVEPQANSEAPALQEEEAVEEDTVIETVVNHQKATALPEIDVVLAEEDVTEENPVDELDQLTYTTTALALEQDYFATQPEEENEVEEETSAITSEPEVTSTPQATEEQPSTMSFTSWLHRNHVTEEKEESSTAANTSSKEIIDRFIEKQPSISKPTAEFYSASKKAKESLDESKTPVSETLAKIYEAQGNYPKAIHVYHQLILNNPEKKSLFAPRIEELKNKIAQ